MIDSSTATVLWEERSDALPPGRAVRAANVSRS